MHLICDEIPTDVKWGLELRVMNGPESGRTAHVDSLPCVIGRGGRSAVVLRDPSDPPAISREHAILRLDGNRLMARDISRNGLYVGDRRAEPGAWTEIPARAPIRLGPVLLLCCEPSTAERSIVRVEGAAVAAGRTRAGRVDLRECVAGRAGLERAWKRAALNRGAPGPDGVTIDAFGRSLERQLSALRRELLAGTYQPMPPRLFAAPKRSGGTRVIAILGVRDRVVQHALHDALQPILDPLLAPCCYAYRPGLGAHHAVHAVESLLRAGRIWAGESDVEAFFDSVPHGPLLDRLAAAAPDPFALSIAARCLAAGASGPGTGLAQGAPTSPLFGNFYLVEFDRFLLAQGFAPVRYADDLVIMCRTRGEAQRALAEAEGFLRARLGLALKADKTRVSHAAAGFTFLGFHFTQREKRPTPEARARLGERLAATPANRCAAVERGWRAYFGPEEHVTGMKKPATEAVVDGAHTAAELLRLFVGREACYGLVSAEGGRTRFTACVGALTVAEALAHLRGERTVARYLACEDGRVCAAVLDIDAASPPGRPPQGGPRPQEHSLAAAHTLAIEMARVARKVGMPVVVEDSGRRGRHVWLLFDAPVGASVARRLARALAAAAGCPRAGLRVELFPRHTEWPGPDLGDAVKLPLGVHPLTGRRCWILDGDGEPILDARTALASLRRITGSDIDRLTRALSASGHPAATPVPGEHGGDVGRILAGCSVVRTLAERARTVGHLRHTHNLILLYTVGRAGEEGAKFLHRALSQCHNYDEAVCQRYIDRLEPDHAPITCRRIREWLEEEGETGMCACAGARRSPVDLIASCPLKPSPPRRSPSAHPDAGRPDDRDWSDVERDMFGEEGA